MKRVFLKIFFLLFVFHFKLWGVTYYVKPGGSDALSGTTWINAWQTLQKAADVMTNGDTTLIAAGFYNSLGRTRNYTCVFSVTNSGKSGSPITFQGYTNGVMIWGGGKNTGIHLYKADYIVLDNLEVCNAFDNCILLSYSAENNTIKNCEVHDSGANGISIGNCVGFGWDGDVKGRCHNAVIDNCVIYNTGSVGIFSYSSYESRIMNNFIYSNKNNALNKGGILYLFDGWATGVSIASNNIVCRNLGSGIALIFGDNNGFKRVKIKDCTIVSNSKVGIYEEDYAGEVYQCIISGNSDEEIREVDSASDQAFDVEYSNVWDSDSIYYTLIFWAVHNSTNGTFHADPQFRTGFTGDFSTSYLLQSKYTVNSNSTGDTITSPCIDHGDPSISTTYPDLRTDIGVHNTTNIIGFPDKPYDLGSSRFIDGSTIDAGALPATSVTLSFTVNDGVLPDDHESFRYILQVSTNNAYTSFVVNSTSAFAQKGVKTNIILFSENGDYYWRVKVEDNILTNSGNQSSWTNANHNSMAFRISNISAYTGPYYVNDDTGSDSFPGTYNQPFRTIQRAVDRMAPGINITFATCYIFPGVYEEQVSIRSNQTSDYMVFTALSNDRPPDLTGSLSRTFCFNITNTSMIILDHLKIKKAVNGIGFFETVTNVIIRNSMIYSNSGIGLYMVSDQVDHNTIYSNEIWGENQNIGIWLFRADHNIIRKNMIHHNQEYGIYLESTAQSNMISRNNIFSNDIRAIEIVSDEVAYNKFYTNYIYGLNQNHGILLNNGDNNLFCSNQIYNNQWDGIYACGNARDNIIKNNRIFHNPWKGIGFWDQDTVHNSIISNEIYDTYGAGGGYGVYVRYGNSQVIAHNHIYDSDQRGVFLDHCSSTTLYNNNISSNQVGIFMTNSFTNYIKANRIHHHSNGLYLAKSTNIYITYNLFYSNTTGIYYNNTVSEIKLNSFTSNIYGIHLFSGEDPVIYRNNFILNSCAITNNTALTFALTNNWWDSTQITNIIKQIKGPIAYSNLIPYRLFNAFNIEENADTTPLSIITGVTVNVVNGNDVKITWNQAESSDFVRYNIYMTTNMSLWSNLTFQDVVTQINNLSSTNFTNFNQTSGTYYYYLTVMDNPDPPVGSVYTNECWYSKKSSVVVPDITTLSIVKKVSNITLNSITEQAIPGATITYLISYSNVGFASARNVVVYDNIISYLTFRTSYLSTATAWTIQYSTNENPDQSFSSADYTNGFIDKNRVKWVRWKKNIIGANEDDKSFVLKCIIK